MTPPLEGYWSVAGFLLELAAVAGALAAVVAGCFILVTAWRTWRARLR